MTKAKGEKSKGSKREILSTTTTHIKPPSEMAKVTILGAAGGIGQPLGLLLMLHSEYVQHLALYDVSSSVLGVATDLSHIDRPCKVTSHCGPAELADAVKGSKVILVTAGIAQKPGQSRDDLFVTNAKIVYNLAKICAQVAPDAMFAIISNPVNSLVPLVCEVYSRFAINKNANQNETKEKTCDAKSVGSNTSHFEDCFRRIFGVTTLDIVRASTLAAKSAFFKPEPNGMFKDPSKFRIPVVGGHAGRTIIPLISQATPKFDHKRLMEDKVSTGTLIESIQQAGIDVLNNKKGKGSATLAMAHAACRFTISLLRAQLDDPNIVECAYVRHKTPVMSDLEYFSTPLLLGKTGYVKCQGIGKVLPFEQQMLDDAVKDLKSSIVKGEDFAKEHLSAER